MENSLNNLDLNFFITLGIFILLGGALFFYCYTRLNTLENSIISHGKILQSFILNQTQTTNNKEDNNDAEKLNCDNSTCIMPVNNKESDKIEISDDEESDNNSDDSDDDSDNDSDDDSDDDNNSTNKSININTKEEPITLDKTFIINNIDESIVAANISNIDNIDLNNEIKIVEMTEEKPLDINETDLNELKITHSNINENDENKKKNKSLNKMNNQELKDEILKKGLASNDDISKLKKTELIEILQDKK